MKRTAVCSIFKYIPILSIQISPRFFVLKTYHLLPKT